MSRTRLTARSRADLVVKRHDPSRHLTRWTYRGRELAWASDLMRRADPARFDALRAALAEGRVVWKGEAERRRDERRYVSDAVDAFAQVFEQHREHVRKLPRGIVHPSAPPELERIAQSWGMRIIRSEHAQPGTLTMIGSEADVEESLRAVRIEGPLA